MKKMQLNTIADGAKKLLKDTANVLSQHNGLNYVVIGGWCPLLRNKSKIDHPGTLDVDILFEEGFQAGSIKAAIESFLNEGFNPSAKHPFQLLKEQKINNKTFVFNIDLLHPKMMENKDVKGMFVDHLDLDIPVRNKSTATKMVKSIVLPNSKILFEEQMYDQFEIEGAKFNLVDWNGMFLTKIDSCQKQKREKDSFDIYLSFINEGVELKKIDAISRKYEAINDSINNFKQYLKKNKDPFNNNVKMFSHHFDGSPAQEILNKLKS